MLILFKINKIEMINCVIRKTLLLSIIKQCIMLFSIHRFIFFLQPEGTKHCEDYFKFVENK